MRGPWYKKIEGKEPKDPRNYGKNIVEAFDRWKNSTKVSSKKYVEPTKENANLIVCNDSWEELDQNAEKISNLLTLCFTNPADFKKALIEEKLKDNKATEPEAKEYYDKALDEWHQKMVGKEEREVKKQHRTLVWLLAIILALNAILFLTKLGTFIYNLFRKKKNK